MGNGARRPKYSLRILPGTRLNLMQGNPKRNLRQTLGTCPTPRRSDDSSWGVIFRCIMFCRVRNSRDDFLEGLLLISLLIFEHGSSFFSFFANWCNFIFADPSTKRGSSNTSHCRIFKVIEFIPNEIKPNFDSSSGVLTVLDNYFKARLITRWLCLFNKSLNITFWSTNFFTIFRSCNIFHNYSSCNRTLLNNFFRLTIYVNCVYRYWIPVHHPEVWLQIKLVLLIYYYDRLDFF